MTTGHDGKRSVFRSDETVEPFTLAMFPGAEFYHVWASSTVPEVPAGDLDLSGPFFPPPGGTRVTRIVLPPDAESASAEIDMEAAIAEAEVKVPGMVQHLEPDAPGMHATATVDIGIVESGEVWLELDDGQEVNLRAGDYIVQNGTRHGWRNRSSKPCVITFVMIGAHVTPEAAR